MMLDLIHKDFKITILKMLKELKKKCRKIKKTMCEHKVNTNQELEKLKKKTKKKTGGESKIT